MLLRPQVPTLTPLTDPAAGSLHGLPAGVDAGCVCAYCGRCAARMAHYGDAPDGIPRFRAVRRVQALRSIGYTPPMLATLLGIPELDVHMLTEPDRHTGVYRTVFARIAAGYAPLSAAPVDDLAETRPWPSPLAWDDIDDPDERPRRDGRWCEEDDCDCPADHSPRPKYHDTVDPIAVLRVMNGQLVPTTRAEKEVIVAEWLALGRTWESLEEFTGWHLEKYTGPDHKRSTDEKGTAA